MTTHGRSGRGIDLKRDRLLGRPTPMSLQLLDKVRRRITPAGLICLAEAFGEK